MPGLKKIAVLTSGGDAPGMNAAVRAVTRGALACGWEVFAVRNGYAGLLGNEFDKLAARDVGGIIQSGGTVLGSARCPQFVEAAGRAAAMANLRGRQVDALVVIGGNGSQSGSASLAREGFAVVGVPSTIDNDLYGNDVSIGCDTAINITLEAIAEGAKCGVHDLMEYYGAHRKSIGFDLRVTRLGHVVRGGAPTAADRVLATRLGAAAIATLAEGRHGVLVGIVKGDVVVTPLAEIAGKMRP